MEKIASEGRKCGRLRRAGRKLRQALAGAVLAAGLMLGTPRIAQADSIELMAGNRSATLDLKASAEINKRLGVFVRARPTVDYSGAISAFALADLTINLASGLDAVAEVQVFDGKAVPRAGAQYFARRGDFSLYTLATFGMDSKPYAESVTALRFVPVIYRDLRLLSQAENVTDVGAGGHVSSTQRLRLGIEWKGWGAGAAADLTETGNRPKIADKTFGWNLGGFVSRAF